MQTIVYLDTQLGYKAIEVSNTASIENKILKLSKIGRYVICIIDLKQKVVTHKCDSYHAHESFIECCYKIK